MATPPPSRFAALLRRSKFASFDPHIGQVYTTYDGHAARGNFGLKRPLAVRRRNAHITVQAVDSREQQTVWRSAESENRWIRMWDEVGVTPRVGTTTPWAERLGSVGLEIDFPVDSEFSTEDKQEASSAVDQGVAVAERRSHALPNFEAMSEKEFERYLAYLRTLRPAFLEFVAKKRKVSLETQSLFRLATNAGDDFKEFLATHAYKEYHQPRPRYIEQQPHRFAGLSYTHAPAVQTLYTTKSHIGRVLTEEIKDAHWVAETAGMVSKLAKGDRGEDQSKVAAFRLNPTARLRHVPQTVGRRPEGMEAVALNVDVRIADSPGVAHARTNPHVPGSPEYVGQRIHRAPDGMTTPPVHTRIESFTYRGDIAAENLLKALQSSIPSPPNP
ncbi:mitochondrial ribosomal protein subunit-domain-containing protein [Cerioporus squamosus]|nr:mitochondrial ribosomal protein subunit-domain-containing protein [Cerioporus squamosus]